MVLGVFCVDWAGYAFAMKRSVLIFLLLSACASFPEVDAAEKALSAGGVAPLLLPTEQLTPAAPNSAAESAGAALSARASDLRRRGQQAMAQNR